MRSLDSITKTHKKMVEKQNISLKQYYRMTYPIWSAEKDEENDMNTCPCTLLIGPDTNWNNGQCKKVGAGAGMDAALWMVGKGFHAERIIFGILGECSLEVCRQSGEYCVAGTKRQISCTRRSYRAGFGDAF